MVQCDAFTRSLIELAKEVYTGPDAKSTSSDNRLHLLRNDFLPTENDSRILQVEINTISASFLGLIQRLSLIHRSNKPVYYPTLTGELPSNEPCTGFADAISETIETHKGVLFVVEEGEKNIVDQFMLEAELVKRGYTVIRRTLSQIHTRGRLVNGKTLSVDNIGISLVYFRSGYDPKHYPDESCWIARTLIERSSAVKCPSVLTQLAGTKKVQQIWSSDNGDTLRRFGVDDDAAEELLSVFAKQVDPTVGITERDTAIACPENWVLKPQREGGGHNLYGEDLKKALLELAHEDLSQYVLMERMKPNTSPALVLDGAETARTGTIVPTMINEAVSELGVYSYYIPSLNKNVVCGHLLRTKPVAEKEGGVNAGFSVLDTLSLV